MKALKWYSIIMICLSELSLLASQLQSGFQQDAFWGMVLYVPVLIYLVKSVDK